MPKHHTQPTHSAHAIRCTRPFETNETPRHGNQAWSSDHNGGRRRQLDRHPPDQAMVTLHLTDDVFLRSFKWARWQPGFRCSWTGRDRCVAWLDRRTGRGQMPGIWLAWMVQGLRVVVSGSGSLLRRARRAWLRQHQSCKEFLTLARGTLVDRASRPLLNPQHGDAGLEHDTTHVVRLVALRRRIIAIL